MAYAILRAKKLKTPGSVAAALQHNFRERETPNADSGLTPENEHHHSASTDQAMGLLRARLPAKHRKDAVLAVEYVMTASPAWFERATPELQHAFFERSLAWLRGKYGAENIVAATVQRDEKTPHLSAFVVPRTPDGRLSAKEFIGNRDRMRADQTSFAELVRDLGLERGIPGSRATHQRVAQHYAQISRTEPLPAITEADLVPRTQLCPGPAGCAAPAIAGRDAGGRSGPPDRFRAPSHRAVGRKSLYRGSGASQGRGDGQDRPRGSKRAQLLKARPPEGFQGPPETRPAGTGGGGPRRPGAGGVAPHGSRQTRCRPAQPGTQPRPKPQSLSHSGLVRQL